MTVPAVIFDMDGTLLNTLDDIARCVNACLEAMDEAPQTVEAVRRMVGDGMEPLCRRALSRPSPERVARMIDLMRGYYREHLVEATAPYEGVDEMLQGLKALGSRLAILTNRPHAIAERLVGRFFSGDLFEEVLGHHEDAPRKPHPSGALLIAEKVGLSPERFLLVGDSPVDIQTGKAARMGTVAVAWGFRSEEELEKEGPDYLVRDPREILPIARSLFRP